MEFKLKALRSFPVQYRRGIGSSFPCIGWFITFSLRIEVSSKDFNLQFWDIISDTSIHHLDSLSYARTDVFLVCFSIDSSMSFANVHDKCLPEINHHCPRLPFVHVSLQTDLRDDIISFKKHVHAGTDMITKRWGEETARVCDIEYV